MFVLVCFNYMYELQQGATRLHAFTTSAAGIQVEHNGLKISLLQITQNLLWMTGKFIWGKEGVGIIQTIVHIVSSLTETDIRQLFRSR